MAGTPYRGRAKRAGRAMTSTPEQTARDFVERYGSGASAVANDRQSKSGTPEKVQYWADVAAAIAQLPAGPAKFGRCYRCKTSNVMLPAALAADASKFVCARCHADPVIDTVPR